jgi:hypothetical protein
LNGEIFRAGGNPTPPHTRNLQYAVVVAVAAAAVVPVFFAACSVALFAAEDKKMKKNDFARI